jgi:4'-phosphopantetheinyl transferase
VDQTRDLLRGVLAHYREDGSPSPQFVRDAHGKLSLADTPEISFNLSHSGEMAVFVVADGVCVGVDCESLRDFDDLPQVAEISFSEAEQKRLAQVGTAGYLALFYALWTRKEALVKAIGLGLSYPLHAVTLIGDVDDPVMPIEAPGHGLWWVSSIAAPHGYAAACASRRPFSLCYRARFRQGELPKSGVA